MLSATCDAFAVFAVTDPGVGHLDRAPATGHRPLPRSVEPGARKDRKKASDDECHNTTVATPRGSIAEQCLKSVDLLGKGRTFPSGQ